MRASGHLFFGQMKQRLSGTFNLKWKASRKNEQHVEILKGNISQLRIWIWGGAFQHFLSMFLGEELLYELEKSFKSSFKLRGV